MDMKEAQTSQAKTMVVDDLQENRKAARKKRSPFSIIFEVLLYVAIIVFCIFVVPTYILQRTVVDGNSMQDTLQNGDSLLVNKFIYRIHDPERYDIIVFYPKGHDVDEYYVKRIYGLPGETVYIDNNSIYINGKKIDDPYAKDAMDDSQIELGTKEKPYTLKSDEYYVLGDHRSVSLDSRSIPQGEDPDAPGPVKRENIAGKVFLRIWPLNQLENHDIITIVKLKGEIIMLHPSYTDLMNIANSEVEQGEQPVVNSRYSIVLATAKRARQIIAGSEPLTDHNDCPKALSIAIDELSSGAIKIDAEDDDAEE